MEEYNEDSKRTYEAYHQIICSEEGIFQGAPVGKFILYYLLIHYPSEEDTGEEASDRKENLTCNEVKPIEK